MASEKRWICGVVVTLTIKSILKTFYQFIFAAFLGVVSLLLSALSALAGFQWYFKLWLAPAKIITSLIVSLVPSVWIYGNPNDNIYWPQASAGGFVFMCAMLFWSIVFFCILKYIQACKSKVAR